MLIREKLPNMDVFLQYKKDYKFDKKKSNPAIAVLASPKVTKLSPTMKVLSHSPYLKSVIGKTGASPAALFKKYLPKKEDSKMSETNENASEDLNPPDIIIPVMETNPSLLQSPKKTMTF